MLESPFAASYIYVQYSINTIKFKEKMK